MLALCELFEYEQARRMGQGLEHSRSSHQSNFLFLVHVRTITLFGKLAKYFHGSFFIEIFIHFEIGCLIIEQPFSSHKTSLTSRLQLQITIPNSQSTTVDMSTAGEQQTNVLLLPMILQRTRVPGNESSGPAGMRANAGPLPIPNRINISMMGDFEGNVEGDQKYFHQPYEFLPLPH
jgi:hypothetical protein